MFSLFLLVESSSEISELIACQNPLFLPSHFDFSWKCESNLFILWTVCWQIWYPQKIQSWPKFLAWNFCSKGHISLNTWWIPTNEGSKFKYACVKLKNSYLFMIYVISFKLRLIYFVDIFWDIRHLRKLKLKYFENFRKCSEKFSENFWSSQKLPENRENCFQLIFFKKNCFR